MPVSLPQGVTTTITGDTVTVKGAKGTISLPLRPGLTLVQEASSVRVELAEKSRESLMHAGSLRSHLANVVLGAPRANLFRSCRGKTEEMHENDSIQLFLFMLALNVVE